MYNNIFIKIEEKKFVYDKNIVFIPLNFVFLLTYFANIESF